MYTVQKTIEWIRVKTPMYAPKKPWMKCSCDTLKTALHTRNRALKKHYITKLQSGSKCSLFFRCHTLETALHRPLLSHTQNAHTHTHTHTHIQFTRQERFKKISEVSFMKFSWISLMKFSLYMSLWDLRWSLKSLLWNFLESLLRNSLFISLSRTGAEVWSLSYEIFLEVFLHKSLSDWRCKSHMYVV